MSDNYHTYRINFQTEDTIETSANMKNITPFVGDTRFVTAYDENGEATKGLITVTRRNEISTLMAFGNGGFLEFDLQIDNIHYTFQQRYGGFDCNSSPHFLLGCPQKIISDYGDIDEFDGRKLLDKDYVTEFTLNDKQHDHIYRINFQTEDKTGKEEVAEENNCINKQHK